MTKPEQLTRVTKQVMVDSKGILFGERYWVSHETITGCIAKLIPTHHKQYWQWASSMPVSEDEIYALFKQATGYTVEEYKRMLQEVDAELDRKYRRSNLPSSFKD